MILGFCLICLLILIKIFLFIYLVQNLSEKSHQSSSQITFNKINFHAANVTKGIFIPKF